MKRLLMALVLIITTACMAEYQVFRYMASVNTVKPNLITGGYTVSRAQLKGYLVTVCCYPCGADMGKNYPSWLYVMRTTDNTNTIWKIPVKVDGGIFGLKLNVDNFDNTWVDYMDSKNWDLWYIVPLLKPANKSWMKLYYTTENTKTVDYRISSKKKNTYDYGPLGYKNTSIALTHAGYGLAKIKINKKIDEFVNPYIYSISGSITGTATFPKFSIDPSNYSTYDEAPLSGTFNVKFSNTLTEKIRGTADWKEIDRRILLQMKYKDILGDPENWDLWYY